ncbi:hypothetical protein GCM10027594_05130 [Hymenobacter agri]
MGILEDALFAIAQPNTIRFANRGSKFNDSFPAIKKFRTAKSVPNYNVSIIRPRYNSSDYA